MPNARVSSSTSPPPRLVERKIVLPGVTVVARLVARVRDRVNARLWRSLAHLPTPTQHTQLAALLMIPPDRRTTLLDHLRHPPTRVSAPSLVQALDRHRTIRDLGFTLEGLHPLPLSRIQTLARYASMTWAQAISRMPTDRRVATLIAWAAVSVATSQDDALDVFDTLLRDLIAKATYREAQLRLHSIHDLDSAAQLLSRVGTFILDPPNPAGDVRAELLATITPEIIAEAVAVVAALTRPPDEVYQDELRDRYQTVRRFLPALLQTITFQDTPAGHPIVAALAFLQQIEGQRKPPLHRAPLTVVPRSWRRSVVTDDGETVDRAAYTVCVLDQLRTGLRQRDVFVHPSIRWSDPRARLLQDAAWEAARPQICRSLHRASHPQDELTQLASLLDTTYQRVAANLPTNTTVRIEHRAGVDRPTITPLEKLDDPPSLVALRERVAGLLPQANLPDVILEIHAVTGFLDEFTHLSEATARVPDLPISLCAVLVAEACNIGLAAVADPTVPALTRARLLWVQQHYVRAETITRANARLVDHQQHIPLAQTWGSGEVASADGLRFVVPVRTVHAGPNPKYFRRSTQGVTFYNWVSDQYTGFYGLVIPSTLRDSLYVLEGLLEHQTSLRPTEIMTDTHGYSDIVFGLFWLLGYQFSPRLADMGDARYWRMDRHADYGVLNGIARSTINTRLIAQLYWTP